MDANRFPQTEFDFASLQNALQNTTNDGRVVSPTSLDWEHSQYSDDSIFMNTGSHDSFSSTATAINTPGINTPCVSTSGINTPEDFCVWDSTINADEPNSAFWYGGQPGESQQRWMHRVNLAALPGYLETHFTHSPRTTSLTERPQSFSSLGFDKNPCDLDRRQPFGPPKADYPDEESIFIPDGTNNPGQHISISVSRNFKRKSASATTTKSVEDRPVKKTAHNMIEKRYRNKLNDSIAELRDTIPSLRLGGSVMGNDGGPLPKLYKATVISKAVEHISNLEKEISRLVNEVDDLRSRIESHLPGTGCGDIITRPLTKS